MADGGIPRVDYNVLAHLRKLSAKLSIYDALVLSKEMREALIKALLDPEICLAQLAATSPNEACYFKEVPGVTFSNEDLLLGTAEHNRPLYISVNVGNFKLSRVLVDPGASVNIMNLKTLALLRIDARQLTSDKMMLRGFNDKGQRALGSVTLLLEIGELKTEAKFHIIDSETSFNALLGRPWLHEYRMVPSSLHQCIKYMLDGEEHCIKGDIQPFSVHEVGIYEDAAYYLPKKHVIFSRGTNTSTIKEDPEGEK
ncbi:retroviral-like aspartic protease [Klebsiella pneumoniae]|nr:retroviral-like aspartic protease [Klebsiella pneumoniae]